MTGPAWGSPDELQPLVRKGSLLQAHSLGRVATVKLPGRGLKRKSGVQVPQSLSWSIATWPTPGGSTSPLCLPRPALGSLLSPDWASYWLQLPASYWLQLSELSSLSLGSSLHLLLPTLLSWTWLFAAHFSFCPRLGIAGMGWEPTASEFQGSHWLLETWKSTAGQFVKEEAIVLRPGSKIQNFGFASGEGGVWCHSRFVLNFI